MEPLLYVALIVLPSAAVIFMAHYILTKIYNRDISHHQIELKKDRQKEWMPMKIDAYQRVVLFLERIHPSSIIMREQNTNVKAALLHTKILSSIRQEYEHNIAQQIFISTGGWNVLKKSKEEMIKIYNLALRKVGEDASGMEYSKAVFEIVGEVGELPSEIAVNALKEELQAMFK